MLVCLTTVVVMKTKPPQPPVGEQELALLRYIADRGAVTVGEAAEDFGADRGLARSTVLTMMERLRRKGQLARRATDGVYRYRARVSSAELLKGAVRRFVERNLEGSVSPFLAYLSDTGKVSEAELRELEEIVARLGAARGKDR
jgi:predicted transcriptional regulator